MKSNKIKSLPRILRNSYLYLATVFALLICTVFIPISAESASPSIIDENYNLIDEHYLLLGKEINNYSTIDVSPGSSVSKSVTNAINEYRKELVDLGNHSDISLRLLSDEISLAYSKGKAAGRLAWIYYYNLPDITDSASAARIYSTYSALCREISGSTDASVLDPRVLGMSTELNREIYKEKINALHLPDDSSDASGIIEEATRRLSREGSPDIYATEFNAIYTELLESLALQRGRDSLNTQFKDLFAIIRNGEDPQGNATASYIFYELKNAKSIAEMNEAFGRATAELLSFEDEGAYSLLFISTLNESISTAINQASRENSCVNVRDLFADYPLEAKRAKAKDSIATAILTENCAELNALEKIFNGADGLVDKCTSQEALELEIVRAVKRRALYELRCDTSDRIAIVLGKYDRSAFEARISDAYKIADEALHTLSGTAISFSERCDKILSSSSEGFSSILDEAKTERFLLDHTDILKKPKDDLEISDEVFLKIAFSDFSLLSEKVKSGLKPQIENIAEKYNTVTSKKIAALAPQDIFYLDLCENLQNDLKNLSFSNIDVFYNSCNAILSKAQTLASLVEYYRSICADTTYANYIQSEKSDLQRICSDASERIDKISATEADRLSSELLTVSGTAKAQMNQLNEYVRLRVAASGSANASIAAILAEARAQISATSDKAEMLGITEKAIFKINRELTKDEINARSDKSEHLVGEMKFLNTEERSIICSSIKALKSDAYNDASLAQNVTVLSFIWSSFSESIDKLYSDALEKDLLRARDSYQNSISSEQEKLKNSLLGMIYISDTRRDEFSNSLSALCAKFKADIVLCKESAEVVSLYTQTVEQIDFVLKTAESENLSEYKKVLSDELLALKSLKSNYSAENYNLLEAAIERNLQKIQGALSLSDGKSHLNTALAEIGAISTVLDDAKSLALLALDKALNSRREQSSLYSPESMSSLESFYNAAYNKICSFAKMSDVESISAELESALALMNGIKKDMLFTSQRAEAVANPSVEYPTNYNVSNGYWGCLLSKNGISHNAIFSISNIASDNWSAIQSAVRKAARNGNIYSYGNLSEENLKRLKKCVVSCGIDMRLSELSEEVSAYTVRMLLTSETAREDIIGIVFIDENGNVEFYDVERSNSLISFDFSHFSSFYIVSEKSINLLPLIIFLLVLLTLEFLALALVLFVRFTRKRKEGNMFTQVFSFTLSPSLVTGALAVQPKGGVGIAIFLSVAVIALGCGIAMLAKVELKNLRRSAQGHIYRHAKQSEPAEEAILLEQKQEVPVLCAVGEQQLIEGIELEEQSYSGAEDTDGETSELGDYKHKAEINIDSIAEHFDAGELVNIELLKKKKLVGKRTDYVKILARGSLCKPLVIEAQDFSRAAEDMLRAVGGEAIRVK